MLQTLSQFDFHHVLHDTSGAAVVMFSSPDCGGCRHLRAVFEQLTAAPDAPAAFFYVDAQRDTALAREFEVFHLPTLFLYRDGQFHCELHSLAQPDALRASIATALASEPQEAP